RSCRFEHQHCSRRRQSRLPEPHTVPPWRDVDAPCSPNLSVAQSWGNRILAGGVVKEAAGAAISESIAGAIRPAGEDSSTTERMNPPRPGKSSRSERARAQENCEIGVNIVLARFLLLPRVSQTRKRKGSESCLFYSSVVFFSTRAAPWRVQR